MKYQGILWGACAGLLSLQGCVTVAPDVENNFSFKANALFRGEDAYSMRAIQAPDLAAGGAELANIARPMAHIAEVGGNTVAFDLPGLSPDGQYIDPAAVEAVKAIAKRVLVRVLGKVGANAEARENAAKTAAAALADEQRVVYWFDGPAAAESAAVFKKTAPQLIVAAPAKGDLTTTTDAASANAASLVLGAIPSVNLEAANFVLNDAPAEYPALDAALTTPEEKAGWTPDNSILDPDERAQGFIALFNGKTLDGWWVFGDNKQGFRVSDDGAIERAGENGTALMTVDRYENFILRVQYRIEEGGNSGVFVRAPRQSRQSRIGMEVQIHGDPGVPPSDDGTGAIYVVLAPTSNPSRAAGEWNDLEIMLEGRHMKVTLNDVVVQDINLDDTEELKYRLQKGFIGLQDHDSFVQFRNVRLKPL
ncbi:MAG: DUF1080 domain-containing protein [Candidatus Hydrogenedentes bacterium]|nr:DUF1080 domain-containing protein [Candidatus Hydrogenedentota bacterium]